MNWSVAKIGTIYQKPAQAIGLSTPPIGCVLDLPGLPGAGNKIYDRSPYGNIGTITGAVWKRLPSGLWYLDFDGQDDYIDCGHDTSLDITEPITILIWVYPDNFDAYYAMLAKGDAGAGSGTTYDLHIASSGIPYFFILTGAAGQSVASSSAILVKTWSQVAVTFNPSSNAVALYKNGAANGTGTITSNPPSKPTENMYIGARMASSVMASHFPGDIALPRIYNRVLSALEIQNHYQQEKHLFGV